MQTKCRIISLFTETIVTYSTSDICILKRDKQSEFIFKPLHFPVSIIEDSTFSSWLNTFYMNSNSCLLLYSQQYMSNELKLFLFYPVDSVLLFLCFFSTVKNRFYLQTVFEKHNEFATIFPIPPNAQNLFFLYKKRSCCLHQ